MDEDIYRESPVTGSTGRKKEVLVLQGNWGFFFQFKVEQTDPPGC